MPGPYFEGQKPTGPCGCFFPDVVGMREEGVLVYQCVDHGELKEVKKERALVGESRKLTDKWREQQREKMRKMSKSQLEGVLKTRQFVAVKQVMVIIETEDGAFMKAHPVGIRLMAHKGKDGVIHEDSDNMVVQLDVRFLDPKCIQEPSGWIFQARPQPKPTPEG